MLRLKAEVGETWSLRARINSSLQVRENFRGITGERQGSGYGWPHSDDLPLRLQRSYQFIYDEPVGL